MIGKAISHYRILDKIGEGGMGVVYKALDAHLHEMVGFACHSSGVDFRRAFIASEPLRTKASDAINRLASRGQKGNVGQ